MCWNWKLRLKELEGRHEMEGQQENSQIAAQPWFGGGGGGGGMDL